MIDFSPRKPGGDGGGGSEGWDGMTPLHLACAQGQDQVVQCLVEYDADINAQVSGSLHGVHFTKIWIFPKLRCCKSGQYNFECLARSLYNLYDLSIGFGEKERK